MFQPDCFYCRFMFVVSVAWILFWQISNVCQRSQLMSTESCRDTFSRSYNIKTGFRNKTWQTIYIYHFSIILSSSNSLLVKSYFNSTSFEKSPFKLYPEEQHVCMYKIMVFTQILSYLKSLSDHPSLIPPPQQ